MDETPDLTRARMAARDAVTNINAAAAALSDPETVARLHRYNVDRRCIAPEEDGVIETVFMASVRLGVDHKLVKAATRGGSHRPDKLRIAGHRQPEGFSYRRTIVYVEDVDRWWAEHQRLHPDQTAPAPAP